MREAAADIFNNIAQEYDLWYENNVIFLNELAAIRQAVSINGLSLEIGVGSGRFASALSIAFGLDPALGPLKIAKSRSIFVVQAQAEAIPFRSNMFDNVFFITSLCFVDDHLMSIIEGIRILRSGGRLIVGFISNDSEWGAFYRQKKREGHKIYRYARFFSSEELISIAINEGLLLEGSVSTLFQPPDAKEYIAEAPRAGIIKEGGFQVLVFKKGACPARR